MTRWYETDDLIRPLPRREAGHGQPQDDIAETLKTRIAQLEVLIRTGLLRLQTSHYRGLIPNEQQLGFVANPQLGDMVVAADTHVGYIRLATGWTSLGSAALRAGTVAGTVKAVPTEAGLLAGTGLPDEVRMAVDTGNFFKWTVGAGWTPASADPAVVMGLIRSLIARDPDPVAGDVGKVLTVTGPGAATWSAIPDAGVTSTNTAGTGPGAVTGMAPGDVFINLADRTAWMYKDPADGWVPLVDPVQVTTGAAATDMPPATADVGDVFINKATGESYVRAATGWELVGPPAAANPGMVLTSRAGGTPAWQAPVSSAILGGLVVAGPATDPHEYTWATLALPATLTALRNGEYLIVEDPATTVPAAVPGVGGNPVNPGDWVVAIDSDADGTVDTYHLVARPADLPPNVTISAVAGATPTAAAGDKRGDEWLNTADRRNWVHDGTVWVERAANSPVPPSAAGDVAGDVLTLTDPAANLWEWKKIDGLPDTTGKKAGDLLAINDPAAGTAQWSTIRTFPVVTITRANYDALGTKDPGTIYVVEDAP